jgi:hypothetical protein
VIVEEITRHIKETSIALPKRLFSQFRVSEKTGLRLLRYMEKSGLLTCVNRSAPRSKKEEGNPRRYALSVQFRLELSTGDQWLTRDKNNTFFWIRSETLRPQKELSFLPGDSPLSLSTTLQEKLSRPLGFTANRQRVFDFVKKSTNRKQTISEFIGWCGKGGVSGKEIEPSIRQSEDTGRIITSKPNAQGLRAEYRSVLDSMDGKPLWLFDHVSAHLWQLLASENIDIGPDPYSFIGKKMHESLGRFDINRNVAKGLVTKQLQGQTIMNIHKNKDLNTGQKKKALDLHNQCRKTLCEYVPGFVSLIEKMGKYGMMKTGSKVLTGCMEKTIQETDLEKIGLPNCDSLLFPATQETASQVIRAWQSSHMEQFGRVLPVRIKLLNPGFDPVLSKKPLEDKIIYKPLVCNDLNHYNACGVKNTAINHDTPTTYAKLTPVR